MLVQNMKVNIIGLCFRVFASGWMIAAVSGCSQEVKDLDKKDFRLVLRDTAQFIEYYVHKNDKSIEMLKYLYEDNSIQAIAYFVKGQKAGKWVKYFEDGKVAAVSYFKDGLRDSVHTFYHFNGRLAIIERYALGKKIGKWEVFDSVGNVVSSINYD